MAFKHKLHFPIFLPLALIVTMFVTAFNSVNAAVMGHVENENIGNVINHTVSPDGKFLYSTTLSPAKVHVHTRDPGTGEILSLIQTLEAKDFFSGVEPSFNPHSLVVSPDSKQLYIGADFGIPSDLSFKFGGSVLRFDIGSNGNLNYVNRVLTDGAEYGLTISKDGKFLFIGSTGSKAKVTTISRAANGNISVVDSIYTDLNGNLLQDTQEILLSPDGKNLYASSVSFDGHLYVFNINQTSGVLTSTATFIHEGANSAYFETGDVPVKGSGGYGTAISEDGKFFYSVGGSAAGEEEDSVSIFSRSSTGALTFLKNVQAPLSSIGTLRKLFSSNADLVISPNQKYLYAFDNIIKNIVVWTRNTVTGDLTYLGSVEESPADFTSGSSQKITLSNDGQNLYVNTGVGITIFDLRSDLSIVKTDAIDPVNANGTIDYTLAVTNNGPSDAQNVVVTDTLPAGTSFVSGSVNSPTGSCSANGQTVTCSMGQFRINDGYNAVLKVTAPATEGSISNSASVNANQLDTEMSNNTDTESTQIGSGSAAPTPIKSSGGGSLPVGLIMLLSFLMFIRLRTDKSAG